MKRLFVTFVLPMICLALLYGDPLLISVANKNLSELRSGDFKYSVDEGETISVESNNVAIAIYFESFDPTKYYLFINERKIEGFFEDCEFDFSKRLAIYSIKELLQEGLNELKVYSNDGTSRSWFIDIEEAINIADYSAHKQVTHGRGWKLNPAVSPDGNLVAYKVASEEYNAIKIYNIETDENYIVVENEKKISFGEIDEEEHYYSTAPCWSRDGATLFYVSNNSGYSEIYRADIDRKGYASNHKRITSFNSYLGSIVASSTMDRIYFTCNKDGAMAIYQGNNAENASDSFEFMESVKRISPADENIYYAPVISTDDTYIAFCMNDSEKKTSIEIYELDGLSYVESISDRNNNCFFPSWSTAGNLLAYYCRKELRCFNVDSNKDFLVASRVRIPQDWAVKPTWAPNTNTIFYITDDVNTAIHMVQINYDKSKAGEDIILLSDKYNANNYEIAVTPDMHYMIRCSFQTNYELWLDTSSLTPVETASVVAFKSNYNTMLKMWDKYDKVYSPLALYPEIDNQHAYMEKEGLQAGSYQFVLGDKEINSKLFSDFETIEHETGTDKPYSIKYGLYSAALPSLGQYSSSNLEKSSFFRYTFWGLAALTAGSFYYADQLHTDYEEQTSMDDTIEARDKYTMVSSIASGLLIGTIGNYLLNVFDATASQRNKQSEFRELHDRNFHQVTSKLPVNRRIYSKKLQQTGELKILTKEPNLKVSLVDSKGKRTDYGTTNLIFDKDTYFTISELEAGNYTLRSEDSRGNDYQDKVTIEKNRVSYACLKHGAGKSGGFSNFLQNMVPGYIQYKRDEQVKAYTIIGFTALSLIGAAYCHFAAENSYSDYKDATTASDVVEHRGDYVKYSNLRNTFLLSFSITYLYGYLDSSLR